MLESEIRINFKSKEKKLLAVFIFLLVIYVSTYIVIGVYGYQGKVVIKVS